MNYDQMLQGKFGDLEINLVRHDTSPTGYPCYIEAKLSKMPPLKVRGEFAKDLSNYIYRTTGLKYHYLPEYTGKGKNTAIRWFMSWDNVAPIIPNICKALDRKFISDKHIPFEFNSLIIQNTARGVSVPASQSVEE